MIFKLHYWLLSAGASALGLLLGVFVETYTDASSVEIGSLFMMMPFLGLIFRPTICAYADRKQAHRKYMIRCLFIVALSYCPFIIIPLLGESFYGQYPRLCWYLLVIFKVFGDIAFGGVQSIGDSLAMNYSRRVGTQFAVYRIWGTISWMIFGLIIGQINEIWFLPKYVPAFIILILCSLLDMSILWLWPKEYFKMLTEDEIQREVEANKLKYKDDSKSGSRFSLTRSLMPRDFVWAHIKARFCSLLKLCFCCVPLPSDDAQLGAAGSGSATKEEKLKSYQPSTLSVDQLVEGNKSLNGTQSSLRLKKKTSAIEEPLDCGQPRQAAARPINKITQIKTLLVLIKRDVRILGYCQILILGGLNSVTANFFFINLNEICNQGGLCNYSSIGGMLQATMASAETLVFIYIKDIQNALGRVNLAGIALFLLTIKYGFYAFVWYSINPHWALLIEVVQGVVFGIFLTQQVETAHMFANEVEFILPELADRKIVTSEHDADKIKLSLSATMQAFMMNAEVGLGRGFGALFYGIIVQKYSYRVLWTILTFLFGISCIITFGVNIVCYLFKIQIGPNSNKNKNNHNKTNPESNDTGKS